MKVYGGSMLKFASIAFGHSLRRLSDYIMLMMVGGGEGGRVDDAMDEGG